MYEVYDLMTLTYIELEYAQSNQHIVLLVVVDRRGRYSHMICSACGECLALRNKQKTVFATLDNLIALANHCDA